jgi:hypothetical protein
MFAFVEKNLQIEILVIIENFIVYQKYRSDFLHDEEH